MIAYLWVALGGAIGSVGRYGFGVAAARLWGDSFPWGTIAINVLGSFVIGFFGALTAPDGLTPGSANLRIFVMVGICGGFTTFSSFSLQTLSLARDGAWFGAAGNIVLSVVACLLAVTLGHVSAERLGVVRAEAPAAPPGILAILDRMETARPVLVAAALAAERLGEARVEALHIRHEAMQGFLPTADVMTEERRLEVAGIAAQRSRELRGVFEECGGRGAWRELTGDTARIVAREARNADLVVIGHAPSAEQTALHAALFQARGAILLVPASPPASLGRHIAVAWKPSEAAERAIAAAMPLLLRADTVSVLISSEHGDGGASAALPPALAQQRIAASVHRFRTDGRGIGAALLAEAHASGADLLVMGAYARNRLIEAAFGGATRDVLAGADLPVLLRH